MDEAARRASCVARSAKCHGWVAGKDDGLLFVGERGAPFRRSAFGRKRRKARAEFGLPGNFRFYDLRHTGNTLVTQSGGTLKDAMVRAGQSSERAALIYPALHAGAAEGGRGRSR